MKRIRITAAALLAIGALAAAEGEKPAQKITVEQLPEKVRSAAEKIAGAGNIAEARKEVAGGKTVYEVEYQDRERKKQVVYLGEDGLPTAHDQPKDHPQTR